jgi:hypothetical protein
MTRLRDWWRGYTDADIVFIRLGGIPNDSRQWAAWRARRRASGHF